MVEPTFEREKVEAMRPTIQETVDDCIRAMAKGKQPVDLVQSLALPVPYLVRSQGSWASH